MRPFAVTLQVISSLLIVLGLAIAGSLVVMVTMPHFDLHHDLASMLVAGLPLALLAGAVLTFERFHQRVWPATTISLLGFVEAAAAIYMMLVGMGEAGKTNMGPFSGLGGVILLFLSLYVLLGAGALTFGGMLSLAAGRMAEKRDHDEW